MHTLSSEKEQFEANRTEERFKELEGARAELKEVLTVRQEAIMVQNGILE